MIMILENLLFIRSNNEIFMYIIQLDPHSYLWNKQYYYVCCID